MLLLVGILSIFVHLRSCVATYTEVRPSTPFAIQPLYAYSSTTTNQFRVRGPPDTRILFNGNGDSILRQVVNYGYWYEFEGKVPITQTAVVLKSDSSSEEMMIVFGDNVDISYSQDISQFQQTNLKVKIGKIVTDSNTTYQTSFQDANGITSSYMKYVVFLESGGRILSDFSKYYSRVNNLLNKTYDVVFQTSEMLSAGVTIKSLYLEVKFGQRNSGSMQSKWFLPIITE